ncbi:MAG: AMP-binding protein, partial [Synergistes sp.]|nr:AMP-binding protein [Synergistes sp.]
DLVSNRVANALIRSGIKQGEKVMYKLRRDEKLIPVMLGISKAGAVFIPIDPEYPQKRIDHIQ